MSRDNRKKKPASPPPGNPIAKAHPESFLRQGKLRRRDKYLRDPKRFAPRFQRLARALAEVSAATLSHEECESLLEFYVDNERRGENARRLYPQVFKHLKTCTSCQITYEALTDAVSPAASRDFTLPAEPRGELPSLRQTPNPAWSKQIHSPITGGRLGFAFTISPRTVASAFASPQFALLREGGEREESPRGGRLLLADSVALGRRNVDVELRIRSDKPESARLEIFVVSSSPLPEPLRVKLHWNDKQYPAVIEQGHASIDGLSVSGLENAQVRVEFEAGTSPDD